MKAEQELAGISLLQLAAGPGAILKSQLQLKKAVPKHVKYEEVQLTWAGLAPCLQVWQGSVSAK